jgi:hypothetical protein
MTSYLDADLQEEMDEFDPTFVVEEVDDELSPEFVKDLIGKILTFNDVLVGHSLHSYQEPFARRIIESVLINDGEEITGLAARQSGKTETVANVVASLMILLPRLARIYPDLLGRFKHGLWVGMFAPVEGQVETMFQRTVTRLTSDRGKEIMGDPEIDDKTQRGGSVVKTIKLTNSGSFVSMMTANPRAKIESKTFHLIVLDEAQECDDFVVAKSISPMLAYYAGTMVKSGTPTTKKNNFYRSVQLNRRRQNSKKGARQNHFEWDWKEVAKVNSNYEKFIRKEMLRAGEDSDEFQLSYCCKWILERGMFTSQAMMDELGDVSMNIVRAWTQTPVVVGVDPARKTDSTVVTVLWVDWDRPDEYGYYDHRVLNWLELQGDDWEEQYARIVDFLSTYNVLGVAVDANGVGDAVAQRLRLLLPRAEVHSITSSPQEQSKRFKHLMALMERRMVGWPAHANVRRTRIWRKFQQQMLDAEKHYKGPNFTVKAPDEAWAHDDFVDSIALGCSLTSELAVPTIEVSNNPFFE